MVITCIEDLHQLYLKRVPRMFRDYVESGSWTESTLRANLAAFEEIRLRQRVLVNMEGRSLKTEMLGQPVNAPVALAPIGMGGMQHADGEIKAARAAAAFGVPYCLSTMSICSIEDVAKAVSAPFWFQLYVMRDRDFVADLIARARAAGCSALLLTVDLQLLGQRHKDIKNGLAIPLKPSISGLLDLCTYPRWGLGMLGTRRRNFGNLVGHAGGPDSLGSVARWTAHQFDPSLNWDDVKWIRDQWGGPLVLKGIMDPEDAEMAVTSGADALIVSNHGGRQLDGAPASIAALPEIVRQTGGRAEVWMDGGIRTGQDIFKAVALGAKGVLTGRAYIYGLGALGEAGVTQALELLCRELDLTMALAGLRDIREVDQQVLWQG